MGGLCLCPKGACATIDGGCTTTTNQTDSATPTLMATRSGFSANGNVSSSVSMGLVGATLVLWDAGLEYLVCIAFTISICLFALWRCHRRTSAKNSVLEDLDSVSA